MGRRSRVRKAGKENHCPVTGKVSYQSEQCANNAAFLINTSHGEDEETGLQGYKCPHCGMWHIGHDRMKK